jgi:hypothetical protein
VSALPILRGNMLIFVSAAQPSTVPRGGALGYFPRARCAALIKGTYTHPVAISKRTTITTMLHRVTVIVIVWLFFGVAATVAVARTTTQRSAKSIDVILAQLGLCVLLVDCTLVTVLAHHTAPGQAFFRIQYASTALYITALWLTKASILNYYYAVLDGIRALRLAWYLIVGATIAGYTCSMLAYPFLPLPCTPGRYPITFLRDVHNI